MVRTYLLKIACGLLLVTVVGATGCSDGKLSSFEVAQQDPTGSYAFGVVYHDRNGNQRRDDGERGIADVGVSNGREVVVTDARGRYALPVTDDTILFVIKPAGWMTPVDGNHLPRFHYIHKPDGSPPLKHAGVSPTGPLPESVDFPLYPRVRGERFQVVLFGDPQPYTRQEVFYLAHDVVEELVGVDASFGVTLGDLVGDDLSLFGLLNDVVSHVGIPWYNVIGNHDVNRDSPDDEHSDESYERVYGPPCYAFDYGKVHFIVIDDVEWTGPTEDKRGRYRGLIGQKQLTFIENDLKLVPDDRMIVLMMHIPLVSVNDREKLFTLLADREHTLSIAAHHHLHQNAFFGKDEGWLRHLPHHHMVNVTTSGSWWRGLRDEHGIPHTTMRDGAPNGYSIITFDGTSYSVRFKAARRPDDHQMTIFAPDEIRADEIAETEVIANVFAGSQRSTVEMRVGDKGPWQPMTLVNRVDPYYIMLKAQETQLQNVERPLPAPRKSTHLWSASLPVDTQPGMQIIHVRTTDMFDQTYTGQRIIHIRK